MRALTATLIAISLLAPTASLAGNHKDKFKPGATPPGLSAGCPPGLAKKNPPCIPPGQAKKRYYPEGYVPIYRIGDRIDRDYEILRYPSRYGLENGLLYYVVGREVFRISPETGRVLAFIGLADALLN
ncbi:excinuclease ABC subunit A [Aestuariivita boseongensis]|uniref:excinuclease ABC subunit A n=1 Tax=Aestuariivita boseongensis TaxID=1470562 RepID=UPI000A3F6477|nr:excinuclease ABC subunit A [Aestuariivita boseongensis]